MKYVDPVCGKKLRRKEEYAILKYGGNEYRLCCRECKESFLENPTQYTPKEKTHPEQYGEE
ncbi:MAG: YHS domain-containing protein [Candidatus Paceibacterota bacterium]|jgi:YHS domain-containing protein